METSAFPWQHVSSVACSTMNLFVTPLLSTIPSQRFWMSLNAGPVFS
jgi:hypothetical protein